MTSLRSRLFHGTAVAAALALAPTGLKAAGLLPTGAVIAPLSGPVQTPTGTNVTVGGSGTTASPYTIAPTAPGAATLNITIGSGAGSAGQFGIINWSGFDVAAGNTVAFAGAGNLSFSVLNRVQGATSPTLIAGALQGNMLGTAGNRGTIFVLNEAGVSFANSATVTNLTGFVASSLDVLDSKFVTLAGTPGSPLEFATSTMLGTGTGTGTGVVHIDADGMTKATIRPDSVLLLVAPKLDLQGGALSAQHTEGMTPTAFGDAGVVLASDATVALNPESIISIRIDKGTAISGSVLNGTVGGQRVLVAAASSTSLMASLLGVGGNLTATTVSATDHGIVIAAGANTPIDGAGHSISFTPVATPAVVGVTGILASSGRVDAAATDALTIGAVNATGAASFTSGTALAFEGDVSAGGLTGSGATISLGADGAAHHLMTTGTLAPLTLTASTGGAAAITAHGDYSINATGPVVLQQSPGVAANVTLDDSLSITGSNVAIGNVALAATLPAAAGSGNVVLAANGTASTDAVVAGTVAARSGITATSATGAVTLAGATSGAGVGMAATPQDIVVTAARRATVSGAVTSTGNYTVTGGDVSLGGAGIAQSAAGDVLVRALTGDLVGGGTVTADSGSAGGHLLVLDAGAGMINAPSLNLLAGTTSDVYLSTSSDLSLGTINARQFASASLSMTPHSPVRASDYAPVAADTLTIPGAITLATVTTVQPVTIASTGAVAMHDYDVGLGTVSSGGAVSVSSVSGAVTLAGASSGGTAKDVTVSAAGIATVPGTVTSTGNYTVSGASVALGGTGIAQTAVGNVVVKSTTAGISVAGSVTADTGAGGSHVLVLDSNAGISGGGSLNAGSLSDVLLAVKADIALGTINARQLASTATAAVPLAANYSATVPDTLSVAGAITLGVVTTTQANTIASTGTTIGHRDVSLVSDASTTAGVMLASTNNVTVGSLNSGGTGDAMVTATGGIAAITGGVAAARDYTVVGNSVGLGSPAIDTLETAGRTVSITSTGGAITAADAVAIVSNNTSAAPPAAGNLTLTAATNIGDPAHPGLINVYGGQVAGSLYGGIVTGSDASRRSVTLDVITSGLNGSITVGNVRGAALTGPLVPLQAGGPVALGRVDVLGDINVTSAATLSLISGLATGNIALKGTTITLGTGGATNSLATATAFKGATLTATAGGAAAITTLGDVTIAAPGAVVLQQSPGTAASVTHDDSLAITGSSVSVGNVVLPATPPALPSLVGSGNVMLTANGLLPTDSLSAGTITARNAVVARSASGDVTLGGATSGSEGAAPHDVTVVAHGHTVVSGNVMSSGDYTATGIDVTLGNAASGIVQQAAGNLYVRSGLSIYASGTLIADSGGAGGDRLVLDASSRSIANSAFGPVSLRAGPAAGAPTSDILIAIAAGQNLTLGAVAGHGFGTATPTTPTPTSVSDYTPAGTLVLDAAISLGSLSTVVGNTVESTGTLAGQRDVTLTGGDASSTGSVTIEASNGAVLVAGPVSAHGNYTAIGGNVTIGGAGVAQNATGDILIRSLATNVAAAGTVTAGGTLVIDSATAIGGIAAAGPPPSVAVARLVATNDVLLRTGSGAAITLGAISAARLASATSTATPMTVGDYAPVLSGGIGTLQSDDAITLGPVTTAQSNLILSTGMTQGHRDITLAGDTSTGGSVEVGSAHGGVSITGLVSAFTTADLHASGASDPLDAAAGTLSVATVEAFHGDATLAGQTALTVATASPVAALGNVNLLSAGAIVTDAVRAGGVITVAGLTPGTGAASLSTTGLSANAGISVTTVGALDLSTLGLLTPRTQINADLSGFNPANPAYVGTASIALTSTANSVRAGAITATGSITLRAATTATVTGNVEAGFGGGNGNYTVSGAQVALGGAGTTQKATGNVLIRSTGGDLGVAGTVIADDAGAGGRRLILDTAGAIATIASLPAADLVAGAGAPTLRSDVLIRQVDTTKAITLGNVTANQLATASSTVATPSTVADYTVPVFDNLTTAGSITLGTVDTVQSATIASLGTSPTTRNVVVADVTSGGSILLNSSGGDVTASGPVVAATGATLTAGGTLSVGDVTARGGGLALTGGTIGATAGTHVLSASGTVALQSSGAITLAADAIGGSAITAGGSGGVGSAAASFAADSLHATGAVNVLSVGDVTLAGVSATSLVTSRATPMAADADANITARSGAITITGAETTGSLALTASHLVTVTGPVLVGDAATAVASGNYGITAGSVTLSGPQSATGNILLASAGAVGVDTLAAGGMITAGGLTVGSGSASFNATTLQANGAIGVTTVGRLALTGSGAAKTATERTAFDPTLRTFTLGARAAAADHGIVLTSTGGMVSVVDLASTGDITIDAGGAAAVSGVVAVGDGKTLAGVGNYRVAGSSIALGGGVPGQAALGNITLQTPGAITLTALRAGGAITAQGVPGGPVVTGAASLLGDSLQSNGAVTVTTTGAITLSGVNATAVATRRQAIDTDLGGFNGLPTASDAGISLTATGMSVPSLPGTISVNGASSTGDIVLTAGTGLPPMSGTIAATGTFTVGDVHTGPGGGNFAAVAHDLADASAATINARHNISVTSQSNNALIGTATAGLDAAIGGSVTAQTFGAGSTAVISSGTATLGDVKALATGAGSTASITTATATGGNILADGDVQALVAMGTAGVNITAHSSSGTATIDTAIAGGGVLASAGTAASITSGTAADGNVDALGGTSATITSGMASSTTAARGNVRATSIGGPATITMAAATQSVVASGGTVVVGSATAGDDIILIANSGAAMATTLTVTGAAGSEAAATDASGSPLVFGGSSVTGLGGSNVIIRASGAATVSGIVGVTQPNAAKTANYDVAAASIMLGGPGTVLNQSAGGRIDLRTTSGDIVLAGSGGALIANVGGARTTNALADGTTAGSDLSLTSAGGITGANIALVATGTLDAAASASRQARQPGVTVAAAPDGGGSIQLASITGGAVNVSAPVAVTLPLVTATGNVALTGTAVTGNDSATISPATVVIDGVNPGAGYGRVNVTAAGGQGAEIAAVSVVNGGQVGALQVLSDSGAATLRSTPSDPTKITSILVESQTGVAGILNPVGGPASIANPNTVAAQTIVLRGRQAGSSVLATGPLLATGSILATGPSVTVGTAAVAGTAADGTGDILIAATDTASLAAGATETAVARRTINVTGGAATLGDGTATGGTLAVSGTAVTVSRSATAGDDIVLTSLGPIAAGSAAIRTTGTADLQAGDDSAGLSIVSVGSAAGSGYGTGHAVGTDVATPAIDAVTGGNLTRLAGANIIVSAAGSVDLSAATLTATAGRDVHVEAAGTVDLATATAARQFVGSSGSTFTTTGSVAAGDDLVIGSGAGIDVHSATLSTTGGATSAPDARRADGTLLNIAVAGGALTNLAGSNIALAAAGPVQLGAITTTAVPSSLRAFSGAAITTTQAITVSGDVALVGSTVANSFGLTAGDDVVVVARGGAATLSGSLMTTGSAPSDAALVDLAGNGISLPGEATLARVDGSSILVAAAGVSTVSANVTSAGRYSVYGRSGIVLGNAGAGTAQSAAGDILLEASVGAAPALASITLADGMTLTANSDGREVARPGGFIADPLVIRLGNGDLAAARATLRVLRTPGATLADQGTVQIQPVIADGVTSIAIQTLDSASADLRALGDVTVAGANVDAGLTLASKAGAVALTSLTIGTAVPLMTAAQVNAIDVKLSGTTGATLGAVTAGTNLARDITVATTGGDASIATASGRDDIVIASATGRAIAGDLTFAGAASDSEAGVATVAATDANGIALADPYRLSGPTITGLAGRNIVVSGATAASLGSVTTAASDGLGDVRVLTAAGPATLTTVNTGGTGLPARVIVATRNGVATGTTLSASGDIIVDASAGSAVLTSGNAGRDGIVVAPAVSIGTLTAGDDVVAVATGGTLTAGALTSTGANSGDAVTTVFRADGTSIVDPVSGGIVGNLAGGNVIALATGDVAVMTALAAAAPMASVPGLVRLASQSGTVTVTGATATDGDLALAGATVDAATLSAGRDATITATGLATLPQLTAGRDIAITAGSANLGADTGLVAAQRNISATTSGALTIGTARAGEALTATGGSVLATTLGAGDALTVTATSGDATVTTATSTGLPLLADFSGFAAGGAALGATRDVVITAGSTATLVAGVAVHGISVSGASANVMSATANTGGTDGDLTVSGVLTVASLGTGSGRDVVVSGNSVLATTVSATRDLHVDSFDGGTPAAMATVMTASVGRNAVIVGPALSIGSITAGSDVVAVATRGTLTAGSLTSTGASSSDTSTAIIRSDGSAVVDPTVAGVPTTGNLTGGNVVALASGDLTVGTAIATAVPGAMALGVVRLASLGATTVASATASAGDIVASGATVNSGPLIAGRDVNAAATAGDLQIASVGAGRNLLSTASNDVVVAGTSTATGNAGVTAGRNISLGASATEDAFDAGGNATLMAGRNIFIARPTTVGFLLNATAGGAATFAATTSGGAITIATQGDLTLTGDLAATGALSLASTGGAIAAPDLSGNGIVIAAAGPFTVTGATSSAAGLTASGGSLSLGTLSAVGDASLHAAGPISVSGAAMTGGALTATADAGAIEMAAVTTGGPATITASDATSGGILLASLNTTGAAALLAGQSASVSGLAQTSGALSATAMNGGLSFGAITSGAAAMLRGRTGLSVAGLTTATGALDALSSAGTVSLGSANAATVTLRGATGVMVAGGTAATGLVAITADAGAVTTGDIAAGATTNVTATTGAATLASISRTAGLMLTAATDAAVTSDINSSGDVGATATGRVVGDRLGQPCRQADAGGGEQRDGGRLGRDERRYVDHRHERQRNDRRRGADGELHGQSR